jgi:hypothetical protein
MLPPESSNPFAKFCVEIKCSTHPTGHNNVLGQWWATGGGSVQL